MKSVSRGTLVRNENQTRLSEYHRARRRRRAKERVREGLVLVNAMHITASVYINDDEVGFCKITMFLERLALHEATHRHNETGEDNGDAHIKRQLMAGFVAITDGKLDFGPGEQIFTVSLTDDGARHW